MTKNHNAATVNVVKSAADISKDRLSMMLKSALGAAERFMYDKTVIEIMLNPDGKIWIDRLGEGQSDTGIRVKPEDASRFIGFVASGTENVCNYDQPILSTELPYYGSRFEALIPPVVESPTFTIRQKAVMIFSMDDYIAQGILSERQRDRLMQAIQNRENILIIGGTGCGKPTFANALLNELGKTNDRLVIIQDVPELQCSAPNTVFLRKRDHVSITRLLHSTMRLRPDRIIVGEVRDSAALDLLKAWNTGHPGGMSTIHANSALEGLTRVEQLIQEANVPPLPKLIAQAVDVVVFITKVGYERKIQEIATVTGYKQDEYLLEYF